MRCGRIHGRPPRQTISQAPTVKYANMVRAAMKWCRIALTRLSCETMHRLDQLTVHIAVL